MIVRIMHTLLSALLAFARATFIPRATLALENAALRQQLTIYRRTQERARLSFFPLRRKTQRVMTTFRTAQASPAVRRMQYTPLAARP